MLHGIVSTMAEFYSRNLAKEIMKGTTQKSKKGGTPFRAPLGYLNIREWVDDREIRTMSRWDSGGWLRTIAAKAEVDACGYLSRRASSTLRARMSRASSIASSLLPRPVWPGWLGSR